MTLMENENLIFREQDHTEIFQIPDWIQYFLDKISQWIIL